MESAPPTPALIIFVFHIFNVLLLNCFLFVDIRATFTYSILMPFIANRVFFDILPHRET